MTVRDEAHLHVDLHVQLYIFQVPNVIANVKPDCADISKPAKYVYKKLKTYGLVPLKTKILWYPQTPEVFRES